MDWRSAYLRAVEEIPHTIAAGGPIACLTSACIDVVVDLSAVRWEASGHVHADALLAILRDRVARGIGGEIVFDWPGGSEWIRTRFPHQMSWGGTGPHAAMALTRLGVPTITALNDRSETMLSVIPPGVPLATAAGPRPAGQIPVKSGDRRFVHVFEYTAGRPAFGTLKPTRSSRIIVRFGDLGVEKDAAFDRVSMSSGFGVAGGLLGGLQCIPPGDMSAELGRIAAIADGWRAVGAGVVHLELAGFPSRESCLATVGHLQGHVTSLGMSESEFREYFGREDLGASMLETVRHYGLDRLCVHSDRWAATATRGDAARERHALMLGSLLAASRAAFGSVRVPDGLPADPDPTAIPLADTKPDAHGYRLLAVPTLHLAAPKTTLGMGDTFTAGCLLALSGPVE
jgi:hypothetical protein